jgi:hypothetical protein
MKQLQRSSPLQAAVAAHQYYKGWPDRKGVNVPNVWQGKRYNGVTVKSADYLAIEPLLQVRGKQKPSRAQRCKSIKNDKMPRRRRLFQRLRARTRSF